jgi:hypothetical protein
MIKKEIEVSHFDEDEDEDLIIKLNNQLHELNNKIELEKDEKIKNNLEKKISYI